MSVPEATTETTATCEVVFTPSGRSGQVAAGATVLEAARTLGVDLDTVCGGRGICGRCQVVVGVGEFPKWGVTVTPDHVTPPGPLEQDYRGRRPLVDGRRLGCAVGIVGDAVIDVPSDSQIHRQVVRKGVMIDDLVLDPIVSLHYVEVPRSDLDDESSSAFDQIAAEVQRAWSIASLSPAFVTLDRLHHALTAQDGRLTVAVRGGEVVNIWPGFVDQVVGVAIDLGSTTIAAHLVDLLGGQVLASDGRMNPQIRFGEDLMSRVSYAMMNPGGATALTAAVQFELDALVTSLLDEAGLDHTLVMDIVLVGNPIMHHLALGIDPAPLGQSPFTLAVATSLELDASAVGIRCPAARLYVAPCIAGHVGGDMAAAILSEGPHRSDARQLLIDIGTNAEIVVGNRDGLWAASSPTGPAFEGAQLSCGQRATAGAIERVRIDPTTYEPRFKVIGIDAWSDEPDFPDAAASLQITGVCGSGIVEAIAELFLVGVIDADGTIRGERAVATDRVVADGRTFSYVLRRGEPELLITQADVRAIQLAKAALRAGIDLLLEHAQIVEVDDIRLAGAFGAHIDPYHAMVLGLIPDARLEVVRAVGNAAGSGAVRALVSRAQRREMEEVVGRVVKIETATEPRFQEHFVDALAFPHRTAPAPHLSTLVHLPIHQPRAAARSGRRRTDRQRQPTPAPAVRFGLSDEEMP